MKMKSLLAVGLVGAVLGLASGCTKKEDVTKQPGFQETSNPSSLMGTMPSGVKDGSMGKDSEPPESAK